MKTFEAVPPQVLLTFRDTLSAALNCSVTFASADGVPIAVERFRIHRRFTSRACQIYHCARGSKVREHVCDVWDSESAYAVRRNGETFESPCGLGYWCIAVPVKAHGDVVGLIQAGERWLETQTDLERFIRKGVEILSLDDRAAEKYRREFIKTATAPNTLSAADAHQIRASLDLFAKFLGLLIENC